MTHEDAQKLHKALGDLQLVICGMLLTEDDDPVRRWLGGVGVFAAEAQKRVAMLDTGLAVQRMASFLNTGNDAA